eukprot:scaffold1806_cov240-Pinguiococcus_pyrenoidosus.AAC.23
MTPNTLPAPSDLSILVLNLARLCDATARVNSNGSIFAACSRRIFNLFLRACQRDARNSSSDAFSLRVHLLLFLLYLLLLLLLLFWMRRCHGGGVRGLRAIPLRRSGVGGLPHQRLPRDRRGV